MVFNPVYNFLFIHIQKNAGTSITKALLTIPSSQYISPAHLRLKDLNFTSKTKPFTFAVVRNPYDRLVSWFEMMKRKSIHNDFSRYLLTPSHQKSASVNFSEFIRRTDIIEETEMSEFGDSIITKTECFELPKHYYKSIGFNQIDYLSDACDQLNCDYILHFENLSSDWQKLIRLLGLSVNITLNFENSNPNLLNWRNYYSDTKDMEWVKGLYQRDIKLFGYRI